MKRLPVLIVTLLLGVVATTATGCMVANRDDTAAPVGAGMMAGQVGTTSEEDFLAEMVAHHQEAVTAAGELSRSDRPEMRAFGESIVENQSAQIEQMRSWLADWYPDSDETVDYRPMMRDLSGLSGDRLDRAFLQDMIGHHMAAVMMAQHLLRRGADHDQVATLARSIRDAQHSEIVQMHRWLTQWFGPGAGSGMGLGMMRGSTD